MISISDKALCKPAGNLKGGTNNDNCFPTIKILNLIPLKVFNIDLDILKPIEAIVKASTDSKTTVQDISAVEAVARLDCLKAQAGGK